MELQPSRPSWKADADEPADCIVVGGGPAGLTAAIYLSRFLRRCMVIDAGSGRAALIPKSHNLPGFPGGISGADLLRRMTNQAQRYGAILRHGEVQSLTAIGEDFEIVSAEHVFRARTILLATGVRNHRPEMSPTEHDNAVARGLIRYCPVCDGYEASGLNIAVLGCDLHGAAEAEFLRIYSTKVTLLAQHAMDLPETDHARLSQRGIQVVGTPVRRLGLDGYRFAVELADDRLMKFDAVYSALGSTPRSRLASAAGIKLSASGGILTDAHQQTSVSGIYAAGDVVEGLDQISVAAGQAAKAATAIHNLLREREQALSTAHPSDRALDSSRLGTAERARQE